MFEKNFLQDTRHNETFSNMLKIMLEIDPQQSCFCNSERSEGVFMRILIIEDDKELAEITKLRLEKDNFTVDVCLDGAEGLYYMQEQHV